MKVAILSRSRTLYSTRRLREAALQRGHKVKVLDTLRFEISLEQEAPDLYFDGKPLSHYDAVIPRIGASITRFGTALVRQFEQMGVFCANSSLGISHSRDKLRSLQILSKHRIGIPPTEFVIRKQDVLPAIERVGGAPVIIKVLEGTQGVGVILAETDNVAEAIIETLRSGGQEVLIQKFVAESKGKDVRAFVVGDRVVAAMRRTAHGAEFRSNVHRGGKAEVIELDDAYERTAVRAAQIMGLRIAGVDMLEAEDGPQVTEVNSSPGLEGIESCTQRDIAGEIIDYVADQLVFPDMDIRQRLTVLRGYGVSEVPITPGSSLIGKSVQDTGLRERNLFILTLTHEDETVALPDKNRVLRAGDKLLCFGKLSAMKQLMPPRKRRRVRKLKPPERAARQARREQREAQTRGTSNDDATAATPEAPHGTGTDR